MQGPGATMLPQCASTAGRTQKKASLPVGEEVTFYRGTDVRVVHQLAGKPAAGGRSFTDLQVNDLHKRGWFPLTNQQVALFWSEGQVANISMEVPCR